MERDTAGKPDRRTFVARQPIFDDQRRVLGYELLYREPDPRATVARDPSHATARTIVDSLLSIGLDTLVGTHRAFFNIGRDLLLEGIPAVLPPDRVVLELAADVDADDAVIAA